MSVTDLDIKKRKLSGQEWAEVTAHSNYRTITHMIPWEIYTNIINLVLIYTDSGASKREIKKAMKV